MVKNFLNENLNKESIVNCVEVLYNGYSGKDLEEYLIRDKKIPSIKKYDALIYLNKIIKEVRDEKIILTSTLNNIFFRSNIDLENISVI